MLVPCWPTQTWFTRLLLIEQPIPIQVTQNVLTHPLRRNIHPLSPTLQLLACKVSGNILLTAKFQKTLPRDVLMHSWRPSTHKQYDAYTKKWTTFCLQRKINSREPNVNDVFTFLHEFPKRKLSYSTINTARSVLSSYLMVFRFHGTLYTVSTHPFVIRYLKGVLNCRTPT